MGDNNLRYVVTRNVMISGEINGRKLSWKNCIYFL